jgi:hypothetical protein
MNSQLHTRKFSMTAIKNPITSIVEFSSGYAMNLNRTIPMANRKQRLQMKEARQSILNKAIVQKTKFLHKIALFCLINQFLSYEFIASEESPAAYHRDCCFSGCFRRIQ